jgi:hypothetical protein
MIHDYAGRYPFVPLLKSRQWPVQKIWKLAKTHDTIIASLCTIFLENLHDLNTRINEHETLRTGFMSMKHQDHDH